MCLLAPVPVLWMSSEHPAAPPCPLHRDSHRAAWRSRQARPQTRRRRRELGHRREGTPHGGQRSCARPRGSRRRPICLPRQRSGGGRDRGLHPGRFEFASRRIIHRSPVMMYTERRGARLTRLSSQLKPGEAADQPVLQRYSQTYTFVRSITRHRLFSADDADSWVRCKPLHATVTFRHIILAHGAGIRILSNAPR